MWDYDAFPAWVDAQDRNAIDPALQIELQAWSDRVSHEMWGPHGPDSPGWDGPGDEVIAALDAEGLALAQWLRVSTGWDIEYERILGAP